jgi:hypothetical protein
MSGRNPRRPRMSGSGILGPPKMSDLSPQSGPKRTRSGRCLQSRFCEYMPRPEPFDIGRRRPRGRAGSARRPLARQTAATTIQNVSGLAQGPAEPSTGRLDVRQTACARRSLAAMIDGGTWEGAHARHEATGVRSAALLARADEVIE